MFERGGYVDAENMTMKAMNIRKTVLDEENLDTLMNKAVLALVYRQ